jgi:histidinol-phosphate aminotransferase
VSTKYFKKSVAELPGYVSPPQTGMQAKLNQNESPFDVPQEIKDKLVKDFTKLEWNRYPLNESPVLKEKLAALHNVNSNQVLLGNGSNQLLQTLLTATIESGDKVLYCPPTFSLFELYVPTYGGQAVEFPIRPGNVFPIDSILETIESEKPKVVLLCSPNNPTGAEILRNDILKILDNYNGLLFLDEAYGEFSSWTAIPEIKNYENLIVSRTFSKAYSLAGLRFGYFIARKGVIDQLRKVNLPYNVNLLTEAVVSRLLEHQSEMVGQVEYLKSERNKMYEKLVKFEKIKAFPSQANFILFQCENSKKLFNQLQDLGVVVRDVSGYKHLKNHLRVNVGTIEENNLFIKALTTILNEA